jgi:hypothetical protein
MALWESANAICSEITGGRAMLFRKEGSLNPNHNHNNNNNNHGSQSGTHTVCITDCPMWTMRASAQLRKERPSALVSVEPSSTSLSGFTIFISEALPAKPNATTTMMRLRMPVAVALLAIAVICVVVGTNPPPSDGPGLGEGPFAEQCAATVTSALHSIGRQLWSIVAWFKSVLDRCYSQYFYHHYGTI